MLYADDAKIGREMADEVDFSTVQRKSACRTERIRERERERDMYYKDYLLDWAVRNKMKFHPSKY